MEDEEDDAAHRLQKALKAWRGRGRHGHGRDRRLRRRPDGAARAEVVRRGGEPVDGGVDLLLPRVLVVRMVSIWCSWIDRVNRSHAFPDLDRGKRQRSGVQARPNEDANAAIEPRRRQP